MGNKISPTTFYEYCQEGNLAAVQTILSQVSPCTKEKLFAHRVEEMPMISTPLFTAIQHHHLPVVQLLLDNGINPNSQIKTFGRSSSETALMHAISWRNAMIVDVLLRYRADSERQDAHGKTALHKACALRDSSLKDMSSIVDIVEVLLKHRADLEAVDKSGNLPLHWACVSGNLPVVEFLLAEHGDITVRQLDRPNKMAKTPLMIACEYNHVPLAQLLLTKGANPFLALSVLVSAPSTPSSSAKHRSTAAKAAPKKAHKKTALCWAVENGHTEIVHLLLAHHRAMVVECPVTTFPSVETAPTTAEYETLPSIGGSQSTLRQRCTPTSSSRQTNNNSNSNSNKEVTWLLDLSDEQGDGHTDTASVSTATNMETHGLGSAALRKKMDFAYASHHDDEDEYGHDDGDHSSHDGTVDDADDMRNSINHLVGCCLLEAILLGHVAIAQALLEHVEFYRSVQRKYHHGQAELKGWETMYARGLSIACRKQRRDMVAMMLRHGQTAGVFTAASKSSSSDLLGSVSSDSMQDTTEDIFQTLSQQARDDPIITALLQQYLVPASVH